MTKRPSCEQRPLRYLSLFSGIGGFELAISKTFPDAECVGFSEIDPQAITVYKSHFPAHRELGDITKVAWNPEIDGAVDLIVAGFPCQDLSSAVTMNKFAASATVIDRKVKMDSLGLNGPRSGLFFHILRLMGETRAPFVLVENVGSMRSACMADITRNLQKTLGASVHAITLNSECVSGQRRSRIFWSNFPIGQPKVRGVKLCDILLPFADVSALEHSELAKAYMDRTVKGGRNHWKMGFHSDTNDAKSRPVTKSWSKGKPYNVLIDRRGGGGKGGFIRSFSPVEAERLQTFPDGWTAAVPKTHRFRLIGNSVTVDLVGEIMVDLRTFLDDARAQKQKTLHAFFAQSSV